MREKRRYLTNIKGMFLTWLRNDSVSVDLYNINLQHSHFYCFFQNIIEYLYNNGYIINILKYKEIMANYMFFLVEYFYFVCRLFLFLFSLFPFLYPIILIIYSYILLKIIKFYLCISIFLTFYCHIFHYSNFSIFFIMLKFGLKSDTQMQNISF